MTVLRIQHPVVVRLNAERAAAFELRLADRITAFAGSMTVSYTHLTLPTNREV